MYRVTLDHRVYAKLYTILKNGVCELFVPIFVVIEVPVKGRIDSHNSFQCQL